MSTPVRSSERILLALKGLLKRRKIKYSDLAKKIGVSLPTMKRWLNSTNLSIKELSQICHVLQVPIEDLLTYSQKGPEEVFRFTAAQEKFLSENPSYLAYFYELKSDKTPLQIEKEQNVSRKSTKLYLKGLEKIGLVKVYGLDSVSTTPSTTIIWDDHGPLGKIFSKEMLREMADRALSQFGQPSKGFMSLWGRTLTKNDFEELQREITVLEEKYRRLSEYNRRIFPPDQLHYISSAILIDE